MSRNLDAARRWFEAAFSGDRNTCAAMLGEGYTFRDHAMTGGTPSADAFRQGLPDASAWRDREIVIDRMLETTDDRVVTQFRLSKTHNAGEGIRVTQSICNILTFDSEGRIVAEESYYDDLHAMLAIGAVARQTGSRW